jgi:tryptophan-rich sensory protein
MNQLYQELVKPPLSPPGFIFPIVWTILYIFMGIAVYLVFKTKSRDRKVALALFTIQLFVNLVWPVLFFRLKAYFVAFLWLIFLWYLVSLTTRVFFRVNQKAGRWMIPYLLWVIFAGYLNLAIVILN